MSQDTAQSDLMAKLAHESPDNQFERFAKCFRNMGVVKHFERGSSDNVLVVTADERGINFSNVRDEKGHDFDVIESHVQLTSGEPEIRYHLQYYPTRTELVTRGHVNFGSETGQEFKDLVQQTLEESDSISVEVLKKRTGDVLAVHEVIEQ